jgi:hypothetical protein
MPHRLVPTPIHRTLGELLRLFAVTVLALPALLGALHQPMTVAPPADLARDAASGDAASSLLADLGYICTPLGARSDGGRSMPRGAMQALCPLCTLLNTLGAALPTAMAALAPPRALPRPAAAHPQFAGAAQPVLHLPPGRGPPLSFSA